MIPKIPGIEFKMPETINIPLKVGGTVSKPTVTLGKIGGAGGTMKDMVKDAVDDVKKKAEEEAKKQAEILKQKAADELKKQLENPNPAGAVDKAKDAVKDVTKGFKLPW
jgi:hypothetical protein